MLTEEQWADYPNYNKPGHTAWVEYERADRARTASCQRQLNIDFAEKLGKRELFTPNLEAANKIALASGLPILTIDDALAFYGKGGHAYDPQAHDRGANEAGAGSPSHVARWAICTILHEGWFGLTCAKLAQESEFLSFLNLLPEIQAAAQWIHKLTEDYHAD